jgi:formylglycine-generating enzyme required for sulfatase activity
VAFDPYHKWLGIPPEEQPANAYRLLGVRLFEADADVISNAADQRMAHLRTHQAGPRGALSQKLLNEVAAARVCLLNPAKKAKYDAALRSKLATPDPQSSQEYQDVLDQLADDSRRELALHARITESPHFIPRVLVACMVLAAMALVWYQYRSRRAASEDRPAMAAVQTPSVPKPSEPVAQKEIEPAKPAPVQTPPPAPAPVAKPEVKSRSENEQFPLTPAPLPQGERGVAMGSKPDSKPEPKVMSPPPEPQPKPEPKPEPQPEPKPEPPVVTAPPRPKPEPEPEPANVGPQLTARFDELKESSRGATPTARRKICEQALTLVRDALSVDEYDTALSAAKLASTEAGRLRDKDLVKQARAVLQETQQREKAFVLVREAKQTLIAQPDDPAANLAYGKFLCFAKGDWHRGLPHLARSPDTALAKLAARDFEESTKPDEQLAIADAWWEAADAEPMAARKNVLLHAAMWYYRASFNLAGTQKTLAEKRIKQAGLETQITNPVDGSVLVLIPEGKFLSGPKKEEAYLPAYYLGMYEVSGLQYDRFIKVTGHSPPTTADGAPWAWTGNGISPWAIEKPVGCIQRTEVAEYCRWAGLRPPTAIEWEKGARGVDGRVYPWGNEWDPMKCQNVISRGKGGSSCPVNRYPEGRSPWGLYNMAGNACEWCQADRGQEDGTICGGGCGGDNANDFTCWAQRPPRAEQRGLTHGFRVARDFRP